MLRVKFAPVRKTGVSDLKPHRATRAAAAYDLASAVHRVIYPHETKLIPLGFAMEIAHLNAFAMIVSRSGLARDGIVVDSAPKVIDPDFRGEVHVPIKNLSDHPYIIEEGQRIAQMIFQEFFEATFEEVQPECLMPTNRGEGGFGSTGLF